MSTLFYSGWVSSVLICLQKAERTNIHPRELKMATDCISRYLSQALSIIINIYKIIQ